jgi:hypothetical protein
MKKTLIVLALALLMLSGCTTTPMAIKGSYSVQYKAPDGYFWGTINGIKGDGIVFQQNGTDITPVPMRYFILMDESRIEMPMTMMFKFDPGRFRMIEDNVRKESGR